jgi:hypothetical protein
VSILLFHSGLQSFDVICFTTETGDITKNLPAFVVCNVVKSFLSSLTMVLKELHLVSSLIQTNCLL